MKLIPITNPKLIRIGSKLICSNLSIYSSYLFLLDKECTLINKSGSRGEVFTVEFDLGYTYSFYYYKFSLISIDDNLICKKSK